MNTLCEIAIYEKDRLLIVDDEFDLDNLEYSRHIKLRDYDIYIQSKVDQQIEGELEYLKERIYLMQEMFNKLKEGIYITDEYGKTLYVNDAFINLSGIRQDTLLGRSVYDLRHDDILPNSCCAKVIETNSDVDTINNYYEGQKCLVSGSPIFNAKGELKRTIAVIRDVSELDFLMKRVAEDKSLTFEYKKVLAKKTVDVEDLEISKNKEMQKIFNRAKKMAQVDSTILILGETGVGKDYLAAQIHNFSKHYQGNFVKVNCGAIPEHLLESELFGYKDGAFTGAAKGGKKGLLEEANEGTLFLDEIGDMPYTLQVKLLNAINDRRFYKIGNVKPIAFTGRIIAATNVDLEQYVEEKRFRKDLYYRLNVVSFKIPPLRKRREDILPLTRKFLEQFNNKYRRNCYLSTDALDFIYFYDWPGNIRELKNTIERLALMTEEDHITQGLLHEFILQKNKPIFIDDKTSKSLKERVSAYEQMIIEETLKNSTTLANAAEKLQIDLSTLVRKKKKYGI